MTQITRDVISPVTNPLLVPTLTPTDRWCCATNNQLWPIFLTLIYSRVSISLYYFILSICIGIYFTPVPFMIFLLLLWQNDFIRDILIFVSILRHNLQIMVKRRSIRFGIWIAPNILEWIYADYSQFIEKLLSGNSNLHLRKKQAFFSIDFELC